MATAVTKKKAGFLQRLRRDEAGNTIAIFAAAIFPALGLIGGGVDMSRIVLTRTSLQAACDSGALMGRKVMGSGEWEDNSFRARTRAELAFDANFPDGAYGTTGLTRTYAEATGNVGGQASVQVPMTLMRVFDIEARSVSVTCLSEQRIPNTDVMFVLDTTGSMGNGSGRIEGLRTATNCFYEALAKNNISATTPEDCGETEDPVNINQGGVRLRFGFVPYSTNVNVGKLLPQDYLADSWTYQSRQAEFVEGGGEVIQTPILGEEGPLNSTGVSNNGGSASDWQSISFSIQQGNQFFSWFVFANQSQCGNLNPPDDVVTGGGGTGDPVLISQTPNPLTFPDSQIIKTYEQTTGGTGNEYRYVSGTIRWGPWLFGGCRLQRRTTNNESVETFTTVTPVTWNTETTTAEFADWVYQPVTHDVSSLKAANGSWNDSLLLPLGDEGANTAINWPGCIEERQTFRTTDGDPTDDWDPIPTEALDLNIDLQPTVGDITTQWAPLLTGAVWARGEATSGNVGGAPNSDFTLDSFNGSDSDYQEYHYGDQRSHPVFDGWCPAESATFKRWEPDDFSNYLDALTTAGNTYHDIGLLWGARFMSTTGLFNNMDDDALDFDSDSPDAVGIVERHMVFMTDGNTQAFSTDYGPYGLNWWDRRQTTLNPDLKFNGVGSTSPNSLHYDDIINTRSLAICDHVKEQMNVTLWVVSFGGDVTADTETVLQQCASPDKFFTADDSAALIQQFKGIASSISNLRLSE